MNIKNLFLTVSISVLSALGAIQVYEYYRTEPATTANISTQTDTPAKLTNYFPASERKANYVPALDFTEAARITTPGVVHVTSTGKAPANQRQNMPYGNPFDQFFGYPQNNQPSKASGSGVIISPEGYIVTNNHVVNNAEEIAIVLNDNQRYYATVIGTDPSTDLALLKIEVGHELPYIPFGNSDSVEIGSWVLAVGNPFNLASTVTAGIVSAKGRNINILQDNAAIESFIQTDAAVNPGNSGGALVALNGDLIGINTAIASPTGSYAGYSFAVPSNLVQKVVRDLREYGIVQRGFLGVTIRDVTPDVADEMDLPNVSGVLVNEVMQGSAADDAGLEQGDVIQKINGEMVSSTPKLQENVGRHRPGDQIEVEYLRKGKVRHTVVTLKNKDRGTELLTKQAVQVSQILGVELEDLSKSELREMGIDGGVKISKINDGKVRRYTDMREGFVITNIDRQAVKDKTELMDILEKKQGGVMIEGTYPGRNGTYYYAFGL